MTIKNIINEWDPYSLFPFAPNDEYDYEIDMINDFIKKDKNKTELVLFLDEIFDSNIIYEDYKKDYLKIADKILK